MRDTVKCTACCGTGTVLALPNTTPDKRRGPESRECPYCYGTGRMSCPANEPGQPQPRSRR
jgi:hypothetical protein